MNENDLNQSGLLPMQKPQGNGKMILSRILKMSSRKPVIVLKKDSRIQFSFMNSIKLIPERFPVQIRWKD